MLDVYDMIHGYCQLLIQMINLVQQSNDCREELKEAASSILYAAPRCEEFPKLQEIRAILITRFGKEFVYSAIELRSNYGVSQKEKLVVEKKLSELDTKWTDSKEEKIKKVLSLSYRNVAEAVQDAFE